MRGASGARDTLRRRPQAGPRGNDRILEGDVSEGKEGRERNPPTIVTDVKNFHICTFFP